MANECAAPVSGLHSSIVRMMADAKPDPTASGKHEQPSTMPPALPLVSIKELHDLINHASSGRREFLVVDVRRTDIEGDMSFLIPGAINLPAQTFPAALPALLPILTMYPKVIFHCSSSRGRGPRCAGWYQDELNRLGEERSKGYVLEGGIKAWAATYPDELVEVHS